MPSLETEPATFAWPMLMSDKVAARYLGVSDRQVWKMSATGELPKPVKLPGARRTAWRKSDLDEFIAGLK